MGNYLKSFDGTKIYYNYYQGNKDQTLVFLHGVGGNWTVWKNEIEFFQKQGFSTIALDLRGHGLSDAPEAFEKYRFHYFSKDVHSILKKEKVSSFVLVGHSLGGAVALRYCKLYPRSLPSSLVLVETSCIYPYEHNHLLNFGTYLTHFIRFIANHRLTREKHYPHFKEIDLTEKGIKKELHFISYLLHLTPLRVIVKTLDNIERYAHHAQSKFNAMVHNLKIPIMVIAGNKDPVVPLSVSKIIKQLNTKAEWKIFPDSHHRITIEKPEKVSETICDFLIRHIKEGNSSRKIK